MLRDTALPGLDVIIAEEELVAYKISQLICSMSHIELAVKVLELENYLHQMERFSEQYTDLFFKYKRVARPLDTDKQVELFDEASKNIDDEIKMAKILKHKLVEITAIMASNSSKRVMSDNCVLTAESLSSEICSRLETLQASCQQDLETQIFSVVFPSCPRLSEEKPTSCLEVGTGNIFLNMSSRWKVVSLFKSQSSIVLAGPEV